MSDFLKRGVYELNGTMVPIRQLCAQAQIEMLEAKDKPSHEATFIACKYGAWPDKSLSEIKDMIDLKMATGLAEAIFELSGITVPKSETALSVVSSTG